MMRNIIFSVTVIVIISTVVYPVSLFTNGTPAMLQSQYPWLNDDIYHTIEIYSSRNKVDPNLVLAVIDAESDGKSYATSCKGAIGYMQVMPFHYSGNSKRLYEKNVNIALGCRYLSYCERKAGGDIIETLKNYNAGPSSKFYNMPYIRKIVKNYMHSREVTAI